MKHTAGVKHTVEPQCCWCVAALSRPDPPPPAGSQIRVQEKPIKDWPAPAAGERSGRGGWEVRKRGQAQKHKNLGSKGESMFESIGNSIGSEFILK